MSAGEAKFLLLGVQDECREMTGEMTDPVRQRIVTREVSDLGPLGEMFVPIDNGVVLPGQRQNLTFPPVVRKTAGQAEQPSAANAKKPPCHPAGDQAHRTTPLATQRAPLPIHLKSWSGRRESNPRVQLRRLELCH